MAEQYPREVNYAHCVVSHCAHACSGPAFAVVSPLCLYIYLYLVKKLLNQLDGSYIYMFSHTSLSLAFHALNFPPPNQTMIHHPMIHHPRDANNAS